MRWDEVLLLWFLARAAGYRRVIEVQFVVLICLLTNHARICASDSLEIMEVLRGEKRCADTPSALENCWYPGLAVVGCA